GRTSTTWTYGRSCGSRCGRSSRARPGPGPEVYDPLGHALCCSGKGGTHGEGLRQPAAGVGRGTPAQDAGRPAVRRGTRTTDGGRAARQGLRGNRDHGGAVRGMRRVVLPPAHPGQAEGRAAEATAAVVNTAMTSRSELSRVTLVGE